MEYKDELFMLQAVCSSVGKPNLNNWSSYKIVLLISNMDSMYGGEEDQAALRGSEGDIHKGDHICPKYLRMSRGCGLREGKAF